MTSNKLTARGRPTKTTSGTSPAQRITPKPAPLSIYPVSTDNSASELPAGEMSACMFAACWASTADAVHFAVVGAPLPGQYIVLFDASSKVQAAAAR